MTKENGHSYKENSGHFNNHANQTWDSGNVLAVSGTAVLGSILKT